MGCLISNGVHAAVNKMVADGYLDCQDEIGHRRGAAFRNPDADEVVTLTSSEGVVCSILRTDLVANDGTSPVLNSMFSVFRSPINHVVGDWNDYFHSPASSCVHDNWLFFDMDRAAPSTGLASGAAASSAALGMAFFLGTGSVGPLWPLNLSGELGSKGRNWQFGRGREERSLLFGPRYTTFLVEPESAEAYARGDFIFGLDWEVLWSAVAPLRGNPRFCRYPSAGCGLNGRSAAAVATMRQRVERLPGWQDAVVETLGALRAEFVSVSSS